MCARKCLFVYYKIFKKDTATYIYIVCSRVRSYAGDGLIEGNCASTSPIGSTFQHLSTLLHLRGNFSSTCRLVCTFKVNFPSTRRHSCTIKVTFPRQPASPTRPASEAGNQQASKAASQPENQTSPVRPSPTSQPTSQATSFTSSQPNQPHPKRRPGRGLFVVFARSARAVVARFEKWRGLLSRVLKNGAGCCRALWNLHGLLRKLKEWRAI